MLEKHYQPNEVEDRIYKAWLDAGAFDSGRPERKNAEPYAIVIPPPNVTGSCTWATRSTTRCRTS